MSTGVESRPREPKMPCWLAERAETDQRQQMQALERVVFDTAPDGIAAVNRDGVIVAVNPALLRLTAYGSAEALIGRTLDILLPFAARQRHGQWVQHFFRQPQHRPMGQARNLVIQRADGTTVPVDIALSLCQWQGQPLAVAFVRDVTEQQQLIEQLQYAAQHDPLTGLANRVQLRAWLQRAAQAAQQQNHCAALLLLDLDDFKSINDAYGHAVGDRILQVVAQRLRAVVRTDDLVARLGGDEFALLLPQVGSPSDALRVADKALMALGSSVRIDALDLGIGGSIGVACCPQDASDADMWLRHADLALYAAKADGRQQSARYSPALSRAMDERARLYERLRRALREDALALHYQPQVDVRTGAVIGFEALLRWNDPELGSVPPGRFIPVAEATGLILPLSDWVLREACRQLQAWSEQGLRVRVAVNLAAQQFRQPALVAQVRDLLQTYRVDPALLELEITESQAMEQPEQALRTLQALAKLGVSIALDDFGTGHSSLALLKQTPVHKLKIERSFVHKLPQDTTDTVIVRGVLSLARALRMGVVAEGVETADQLAFLRRCRCPIYQGWLFAPALPAEDATALLAQAGLHTTRSGCARCA